MTRYYGFAVLLPVLWSCFVALQIVTQKFFVGDIYFWATIIANVSLALALGFVLDMRLRKKYNIGERLENDKVEFFVNKKPLIVAGGLESISFIVSISFVYFFLEIQVYNIISILLFPVLASFFFYQRTWLHVISMRELQGKSYTNRH